jgi:hypothetical protein
MFALLFTGGCSGAALTAGSMAADAGLDHTLSGISYKTFAASINDMRAAVFNTMYRLDMDIADQTRTKAGWIIIAKAGDRTIEAELESLTRRLTRLRVVAHNGDFFFKDASTATEIIVQTAETLAMTGEAEIRSIPVSTETATFSRRK